MTCFHRQVRLKAAAALSHLIVIHMRPDPLFNELYNSVKTTEDPAIRETSLQALRGVLTPAGDRMSEAIRKSVTATLQVLVEPRLGPSKCVPVLTGVPTTIIWE